MTYKVSSWTLSLYSLTRKKHLYGQIICCTSACFEDNLDKSLQTISGTDSDYEVAKQHNKHKKHNKMLKGQLYTPFGCQNSWRLPSTIVYMRYTQLATGNEILSIEKMAELYWAMVNVLWMSKRSYSELSVCASMM